MSCAAAVALLLAAAAGAQRRHPSLVVEDSYRDALADLAAGTLEPAIGRVVGLEDESSAECLLAIELHTAEQLAEREPEALVGQAFLRLAVHETRFEQWQGAVNLWEFERDTIDGLRQLGDLYVAASQRGEAPSVAAAVLAYLAHMVAAARSQPRLGAASDLLEAAVELDPDRTVARYSLAEALELQGRPEQALPHLDRLVELAPEDPWFRMRHALVTVKAGRLERGERLLEELTADGPTWVRDLATQELARLLRDGGREAEAVAALRRGLVDLPREKLSLQLAALLDPEGMDGRAVLDAWLAARQSDSGPSARWVYEDREGAREEREALRRWLWSAAADRLGALEKGLKRLPEPPDWDREIFPGCW